MSKPNYTFHSDAGHGWLEVPLTALVELGIYICISPWSYIDGESAFLEEDCDATTFYVASENAGKPYTWDDEYKDESPIRCYKPFPASPQWERNMELKITDGDTRY